MSLIRNLAKKIKGKPVDSVDGSRVRLARQSKSPQRFSATSEQETMALLEAVLMSRLPQDEKLRRLEAIIAATEACHG